MSTVIKTQIESQPESRDGEWALASGAHHRRILGRRDRSQGLLAAQHEIERLRRELDESSRALEHSRAVAREVDHRAKNAFAMVAAMLRTQGRRAGGSTEVELRLASNRVTAMALVHQAFSRGAKEQAFALHLHLAELCHTFDGLVPDVAVTLMAEEVECSAQMGGIAGLLVNEAVTNALKHAFGERSGLVRVGLSRTGDESVDLTIEDDGQGPGPNAVAGLGLGLMRRFAEQLGGALQLCSGPEGGYKVSCKFSSRA